MHLWLIADWCIAVSTTSFFDVSFGPVPYFLVCVILRIGSLISFSQFDFSTSCLISFLYFLWYVFCCIFLTTFGTSKTFSFNSLSRKFLSVTDVINFDIGNSVLISGNLHSLSLSINFSEWSSGVSLYVCFFCFAQKEISS